MGVCPQLVTMKLVNKPKLHNCHLHDLWAVYPKHVFLLEFLVGLVLVGVNQTWKVHNYSIVLSNCKLPKKSQNNGFKICELI